MTDLPSQLRTFHALITRPVTADGLALLAGSARLAIYRRGYRARHRHVLRELFPRVAAWLGDGFDPLVTTYLAGGPQLARDVESVGHDLPMFLAARGDVAVAELAAFELACWHAATAPDQPALPVACAAGPGFVAATIRIAAHVQTLRVQLPLVDERRHLPDERLPIGVVAVWRDPRSVRHRAISDAEATAVDLARTGATVPDLCAALATGGATDFVFDVFARWFARGWITSLHAEAPCTAR